MSKIPNLLTPNLNTRNPEFYASIEVLWGGLGDLVHETEQGSPEAYLDYFLLSRDTTSYSSLVEQDALQFRRSIQLACWVRPEKSNDITIGHSRNYALRFVDDYSFRGGPVNEVTSSTHVTTEVYIGRWAVGCARQFDADDAIVEWELPDLDELHSEIDLNSILEKNEKRYDFKKQSYQEFRDKARALQAIDMHQVTSSEARTLSNDVMVGEQKLSAIVDDVRRYANFTNQTRLTMQRDKPLWGRLARQSPTEYPEQELEAKEIIDKA